MNKIAFSLLFSLISVVMLQAHPAQAADFSAERSGTWQTFKQLYIEGYKPYPTYGLVFDPSVCNNTSNDSCDYAVSEGAGYGMLLAIVQNDQATFDKIYYATQKWMWNGKTYDWKISTSGDKWGTGGATDADEDIAMALIMADKKQAAGSWHANADYGKQAQVLINNIFDYMTVDGYLKPGDQFGGPQELNLSYFSPAWYRVFDQYEHTDHNWKRVIDTQYEILDRVSDRYTGIIPDWSDEYGNSTGRSFRMSYDAIRTPWRIAIDQAWNDEPRAQAYVTTALNRVIGISGVHDVKMYEMNGAPTEYHNELAVAMWAAGAHASTISDSNKKALNQDLKSFYNTGENAFNAQWPPARWYYFNQSLAMLGAAVIDGSLNYTSTGSSDSGNGSDTGTGNDDGNTGGDSGNGSGDTKDNEDASAQKIWKHKGKIAHQPVIVRVVKQDDTIIVQLKKRNAQKKKWKTFYSTQYVQGSDVESIHFHKRTITITHKSGYQKKFRVYISLKAKVLQ